MAQSPIKMTEGEYLSVLRSYEAAAVQNNNEINRENEDLLKRYRADPYGDEQPERSSVVSTDVADVVDADMPSLARNFLGAAKVVIFEPNGQEQEDIDEARQKTEYIDWIIRGQQDSFRVQHGFLKDIEIEKAGVVKYMIEEVKEKRTVEYEDITLAELAELEESLDGEDVESIEIVERSELRMGQDQLERVDVKFEVVRINREVRVTGIPLESFLISPNAVNEDDANLIGDEVEKTRGELLQEGFSRELVAKLPTSSNTNERSNLKQIRFEDEGGIQEQGL